MATRNTNAAANAIEAKVEGAANAGIVLLSSEAILKDQDGIKVDLNTIDARIHANAVQCLLHCSIHRDTSLMRRLLVDIIDAKTGYRRRGLIAWMRTYSPMELKGDTINLSGKDEHGKERPFRVAEANAKPFRGDPDMAEQVKPVFADTLMSPLNVAAKNFRAAWANTKDGKPIDASKPYFDGLHGDKVLNFFEEVQKLQGKLPADDTKKIRKAQDDFRNALGDDETAAKVMREMLAPKEAASA